MDEFDDDEDDFLLSIPLEEQSTGTNDVFLAFINRILCFTKLDYTARCNLFEKGPGKKKGWGGLSVLSIVLDRTHQNDKCIFID